MKKLLIFHPTIAPYRIDFFNSLYEAFETRVCLLYRNLKSQKFDYAKIEKQFVYTPEYLKEGPKIGGRRLYSGYWKHLCQFKPDIVITEEFSIGTLLVLLFKKLFLKKFIVITICDDSYNMVAENNEFSKMHRWSRKLATPLLNDVILVEPRTVEWYQQHYGKGFYFPIIKEESRTRENYKRILPQSNDLEKQFNLSDKCIFLSVGRLIALKNVATVIRAFSKLDQTKNALVIIGDGPERDNLKVLAQEMPINVIFTGRLEGDDLNAWYNVADSFVLASVLEPFGAVTNEALLAGCWSLISCKAGSQCLIENGKNGYTFDPMNIDDLYSKMLESSKKLLTKKATMNNVKENLMLTHYDELMQNLILHIRNLQ